MPNQITDYAVYSRLDNAIIKINYLNRDKGIIDFNYIDLRGDLSPEEWIEKQLAKIIMSNDYNKNEDWKIYYDNGRNR